MHVLTARLQRRRLMGRTVWNGFVIYGDVDSATLAGAAAEALRRLQADEHWLALHPRCGTNLASGVLATIVLGETATLVLHSQALRRMALGAAALAGLLLARPLGRAMQEHVTTLADLRGARILAVRREGAGRIVRHRVIVAQEGERS